MVVELLEDLKLSGPLNLAHRKALRSFIGVPNKVSNNVLDLIFPDFSFDLFISKRKHGFLRRMSRPCETLASAFFLEDRITSFPGNRGFTANLQKALRAVHLEELSWTADKSLALFGFQTQQDKVIDGRWVKMASARSSRFLVIVFGDRHLWHDFVSFAAGVSRSGLRMCLLTWTGSLDVSLGQQASRKCPFCSAILDPRHYFLCGRQFGYQLKLVSIARQKRWPTLFRYTLDIYFKFLFRLRPSVLSDEEGFLFDWETPTTSC
jgi:hypothetical protein